MHMENFNKARTALAKHWCALPRFWAATNMWIVVSLLTFVVHAEPNPPLIRIEGQIYITRKDRETVKMSLVTVRIVEASKVKAVVERVKQSQSDAQLAVARYDDWRERSMALAKAIPKMKPADADKAKTTMSSLRTLVISNAPFALRDIATAKQVDRLRLVEWPSAKTIQTDADGAFTIEMPPGNWMVVAWADRKIIKEDEEYLWIIPARAGERTLLNNSNLFAE